MKRFKYDKRRGLVLTEREWMPLFSGTASRVNSPLVFSVEAADIYTRGADIRVNGMRVLSPVLLDEVICISLKGVDRIEVSPVGYTTITGSFLTTLDVTDDGNAYSYQAADSAFLPESRSIQLLDPARTPIKRSLLRSNIIPDLTSGSASGSYGDLQAMGLQIFSSSPGAGAWLTYSVTIESAYSAPHVLGVYVRLQSDNLGTIVYSLEALQPFFFSMGRLMFTRSLALPPDWQSAPFILNLFVTGLSFVRAQASISRGPAAAPALTTPVAPFTVGAWPEA